MYKRRTVDDELAALDELPAEAAARAAALAAALAVKHPRVVAKAAQACSDGLDYGAVPVLRSTFARFLGAAPKLDPSCHAKKALVRALVALDCADVELYLRGMRYRQLEPIWGGTADTAADVRSHCAMGLIASGYPRALVEVADLLNDPEPAVRCGAARAIACANPRDAELVLRTKVACGDAEPAVLDECFNALLAVAPDESVEVVARYLEYGEETVRELAALALGESRLPAAFPPLKAAWSAVLVSAPLRRALLRAAAAHRSDPAYDWLLELAATAGAPAVLDIIDVLAAYKHNTKLACRMRVALTARADQILLDRFATLWT